MERYVPIAIGSNVYIKIRICSKCGHVVEEDDECNFCTICGTNMRGETDGNN